MNRWFESYANEWRRYDAFELSVYFAFPCDETLSPTDCVLDKG
jgi:hypothetical protein